MTAASRTSSGTGWAAVLRSAIVGTQREAPRSARTGEAPPSARTGEAPPSARTGEPAFDALLAAQAGATPEAELLRAAAVIGLAQRAGARPADLAGEEIAAAPPETLPRCSADAARDLLRLLEPGAERALLPEWLELARDANVRVPEELVPRLLVLGETRRDLHAAIVAVSGARGAWLGAQRPEWSYAAGADDPERVWHDGDRAARVRALAELRERDAARARALLEAAWEREPPAERAAFLAALAARLDDGDEPFLEAALDDRRKDVRSVAAALLARLPRSRLVARAIARADALIVVSRRVLGGASLSVTLPAECDAAMQRDGFEPRPPAGTGERAWWLQQLVARVPPAHWTASRGIAAPAMLTLAAKSDVATPLLRGLARATLNFGGDDWYAAWARDPAPLRDALGYDEAGPAAPAYAAAVLCALDANVPAAMHLARTVPGPWDTAFSRAVVRAVRRALAAAANDPGALTRGRELLAAAATRIAPVPEVVEGWLENAAEERQRGAIEHFIEIVCFRAEMRVRLKAGR